MMSPVSTRLLPAVAPLTTWRAIAWFASSGLGLALWLLYPNPRSSFGMPLLLVSGVFLHPFPSSGEPVSFRRILVLLTVLLLFLALVVFALPLAAQLVFRGSPPHLPWLQTATKIAGLVIWLVGCLHVLRRLAAHRHLQASA